MKKITIGLDFETPLDEKGMVEVFALEKEIDLGTYKSNKPIYEILKAKEVWTLFTDGIDITEQVLMENFEKIEG